MNHKKFYVQLGNLLYALANADGKIHAREIAAVKKIVRDQLVTVETEADEYGVNDAYYAEFEFDTLCEKAANAETAFRSFLEFARQHRDDFSNELWSFCIRMAEQVGDSFRHLNNKESRFLFRLRKELEFA